MINLNTSIYSFIHRVAFQSPVDTTKQDILCVSQTSCDKTFQNPSYLPTDYNEIIKKKDIGVSFASKKTRICNEQTHTLMRDHKYR